MLRSASAISRIAPCTASVATPLYSEGIQLLCWRIASAMCRFVNRPIGDRDDQGELPMSRHTRLVEQAILARFPQRRSGLVAVCNVLIRAGIWGLLICGLAAIVPQVIPALLALQPKLPPPRGPVMSLVNFLRTPQLSVPVVSCLLVLVDLPIAYLTSGNLILRRWWSRLMLLIPLGLGLVAAGGFAVLYFQLLALMVQDAGI